MKNYIVMSNEVRSYIMQQAWSEAKIRARKLGGKPNQYISYCLKTAWASFKNSFTFVKKSKNIIEIVDWWYKKNAIYQNMIVDTKVVRETEKAILVNFTYTFSGSVNNSERWVPKSLVK